MSVRDQQLLSIMTHASNYNYTVNKDILTDSKYVFHLLCPTFGTFGSSLMFSVEMEDVRSGLKSSSTGSCFILMRSEVRDRSAV